MATPAKDDKAAKPVPWRRVLTNVSLLVIALAELALTWWMLRWLIGSRPASLLVLGPIVLPAATWVILRFIKRYDDALKGIEKSVVESARTTWVLLVAILVLAYPTIVTADWLLAPLLRIVPGNRVFNLVAMAEHGKGAQYVLRVWHGGKPISENSDVTGAGSIYVGKAPRAQLEWIPKSVKEKQVAKMKIYRSLPEDGTDEVIAKWTDPGAATFIEAALPRDRLELELRYQIGGEPAECILKQPIQVKAQNEQMQLVFLERGREQQVCNP